MGPSEPRHILLDARKLGHGGIGVYIDNLISGLLSYPDVHLTLIADPGRAVQYGWASSVQVIEDMTRPYSFDEMLRLPRRVDMSAFDLLHVPHYTLPFGVPIPAVITIHDLIHVHYPEKFYYPFIARPWIKSAMRRADRILAVSNATYKDLSALWRKDKRVLSKIRVIPNALDPDFLENARGPEWIAQRFQIRGRYLLSVFSMVKPHKGLTDLLAAFDYVRNRAANNKAWNDVKLVLVGQGLESLVELEQLLEAAGSVKGVHILGAVNKEELVSLYSAALGLVVPSYAEGFCLPVLEAQAVGTPVLARPVPAISELLTSNDMLCPDFSVDGLKEGLATFLEKRWEVAQRRIPVVDAARIRRFCRKELAGLVLGVYDEAIGERRAELAAQPVVG